jgi:hypothetical protein
VEIARGRHTPAGWERMQPKDWACLANFLTGEAASPSEYGVVLYKQLARYVINCTYLIWRSAACIHIRKLRILQLKYNCISTIAPGCVGNKKIQKDLRVLFFADHIRALTESFDSNLDYAGNPYFGNLKSSWADQGLINVPDG